LLKLSFLILVFTDAASGTYLSEISFVTLLLSWPYFRLYLYPTVAMYNAYDTRHTCPPEPNGIFSGPPSIPCWIIRISLIALLGMHAYWYYLILRIAKKLVSGAGTKKAGNEYNESDDD
jgi:hypothetical protein